METRNRRWRLGEWELDNRRLGEWEIETEGEIRRVATRNRRGRFGEWELILETDEGNSESGN